MGGLSDPGAWVAVFRWASCLSGPVVWLQVHSRSTVASPRPSPSPVHAVWGLPVSAAGGWGGESSKRTRWRVGFLGPAGTVGF